MGEPARQLADRLHLLGLPELIFDHPPFGCVLEDEDDAAPAVRALIERGCRKDDVKASAVGALMRDADAVHEFAAGDTSEQRLEVCTAHVRKQGPWGAEHARRRQPENLLGPAVPAGDHLVLVERNDAEGR